ncbi:MAG: helix-turn-helix domain-containing protein, partial [Alcaligenes aquatilis]|jgi:transcriptional regulator GlxA family with amidase domain
MQFLKQIRLEAAQQAIRTATPGTQVSEIALRCGFNHFGRFCADYKSRFGRSPSQDLRIVD